MKEKNLGVNNIMELDSWHSTPPKKKMVHSCISYALLTDRRPRLMFVDKYIHFFPKMVQQVPRKSTNYNILRGLFTTLGHFV